MINKTVTHKGGCHCKRVRYELIGPQNINVLECSCSICLPILYLHYIVPKVKFKLIDYYSLTLCNYTDVSATGKYFFFIEAKSSKIHDFRSKFQKSIKIVLDDEFHRNRCQNEGLGLNFQEKI